MLALKTAYQTDPAFHDKINTILKSQSAPKNQTNSQTRLPHHNNNRMADIPEEPKEDFQVIDFGADSFCDENDFDEPTVEKLLM